MRNSLASRRAIALFKLNGLLDLLEQLSFLELFLKKSKKIEKRT